MPLTYSIPYGLIAGVGTWLVIKAVTFPLNKLFGIPDPSVIKVPVDVEEEEVDAEAAKEADLYKLLYPIWSLAVKFIRK